MRKTTQNARNLASRANFVTQAPPTGHAGRILSRNTLHSGNAGRVPSRLQLRGRTLAPECARKPLDMHAGGAARTHVVGPRCRSSGLHAPGAHTQGLTQYSQERGKHNQLKHRLSRATKPKSHRKTNTLCPLTRKEPPPQKKDSGHAKAGPDAPTRPTTRRLKHHVCAYSPHSRSSPQTRGHHGHEKSTPEGVLFKNAEPPPVDRTEGGRCAPEGTRTPNLLVSNRRSGRSRVARNAA